MSISGLSMAALDSAVAATEPAISSFRCHTFSVISHQYTNLLTSNCSDHLTSDSHCTWCCRNGSICFERPSIFSAGTSRWSSRRSARQSGTGMEEWEKRKKRSGREGKRVGINRRAGTIFQQEGVSRSKIKFYHVT